MRRWRVYKDESEFEWAPWHATDGRYLYRTQSFADALAHADQRARTIQVTLPPVVKHPSNDVPGPAWHASENLVRPWVSTYNRSVWRTDHRGLGGVIGAETAEQLGLTLIAAAKHAKGELP